MLPHEAYRFPCPNLHCRHLSAVEGECCCLPCYEAWRDIRPHAIPPYGPRGHEQPCAHAQQVRLGALGYVQLGDEVQCSYCHGWHPVVAYHAKCVTLCGTLMLDLGAVGTPYLAILTRRRPTTRAEKKG
jgi:hypothetical protein